MDDTKDLHYCPDDERSSFMMDKNFELENAPCSVHINTSRLAHTHKTFVEKYGTQEGPHEPWKEKFVRKMKSKYSCSGQCLKNQVLTTFPFISMLMNYQWKKWIVSDVIAGLSVGVIHIPQGLGFAVLTNLKPIYGLYASIFPVWFYFLFGSSRHISVGTMALISLMIGEVVNREFGSIVGNKPAVFLNETNATASPDEDIDNVKVGIAMSVSLMMGLFQLAMWLFRLDVIATFMSMTFNQAFMTGAACQIITSQLSSIFGLEFERPAGTFALPKTYIEIFKNITETNVATLLTALICITFLLLLKLGVNDRFKSKMIAPIPAEFLVIILGTLISHFAKLNEKYGLKIVGDIPVGIPAPAIPPMTNAGNYIVDSIILAVLGFVISLSMAKIVAKRQDYAINPSQEILAYGVQNAVGALFNSFGGTQAPPRTLVCESSAKTQLACLISSILPLLVCVALGPLFYSLPYSVLSAIIVVALLPLLQQFSELPMLWRISKVDFIVWVVTVGFTTFFSIPLGLVSGVVVNVFLVIIQSQLTFGILKTVSEDSDLFCVHNGDNGNISSSLVYQMNTSLYYANADIFKKHLSKSINKISTLPASTAQSIVVCSDTSDELGETAASENEEKIVILDCSAITFIDLMGVNLLKQLRSDLKLNDIRFALASCRPSILKTLDSAGALRGEMALDVFPSVQDAVAILEKNSSG